MIELFKQFKVSDPLDCIYCRDDKTVFADPNCAGCYARAKRHEYDQTEAFARAKVEEFCDRAWESNGDRLHRR